MFRVIIIIVVIISPILSYAQNSASHSSTPAQEPTVTQIYAAAQAGKLELAQAMVKQVLVAHPDSAKAHFVQSEIYIRQGNISKARDALNAAERLAPGLPFATEAAIKALRSQLNKQELITAGTQATGSRSTVANAKSDVGDDIGKAYEDQLRCDSNPKPGKALMALRNRGYIGMKPSSAVDGMLIFTVLKPLTVFGMHVIEVSGWEADGDKSLFWRGPGTAPPLNIQAVVEGAPSVVKAELQRRFVKKISVSAASYSNYPTPATEVTCYGS